jgi:hypothetical protein
VVRGHVSTQPTEKGKACIAPGSGAPRL